MERGRKLFWSERVQQLCLILLALLWFWKGETSMFKHFTYWSDYEYHNLLKSLFYIATSLFVCFISSSLIYFIEKQKYKRLTRLSLFLIPLAYIFISILGADVSGNYFMFIAVGIPLVALIHLAQTINDNKKFALLKQKKGGSVLRIERLIFISLSLYILGLEFLFPFSFIGLFLNLLGTSTMVLFFLPLSLYCILCFYLIVAWQKLRRNMQVCAWICILSLLSFIVNLLLCLCVFFFPELVIIYFGLMALLSLVIFYCSSKTLMRGEGI